jgi:hypothetical protein
MRHWLFILLCKLISLINFLIKILFLKKTITITTIDNSKIMNTFCVQNCTSGTVLETGLNITTTCCQSDLCNNSTRIWVSNIIIFFLLLHFKLM